MDKNFRKMQIKGSKRGVIILYKVECAALIFQWGKERWHVMINGKINQEKTNLCVSK